MRRTEEKNFIACCGLWCGNCSFKAKVIPAASILCNEMRNAGFEGIVNMMPNGKEFWTFLKGTVDSTEITCRGGCGNPSCGIRLCADEKDVEMCAFCDEYPCGAFAKLSENLPLVSEDNEFLRKNGVDAFIKMQKERRSKGFVYSDHKA
ncbi:MAG: DUF3795 domain-containing protein [Methanomassiliicoccaceae archaeon]|nr:DUF3795 domain-containing protein [Methanomassiliicoccaceae archaeon]